jgi:hypothetical protein
MVTVARVVAGAGEVDVALHPPAVKAGTASSRAAVLPDSASGAERAVHDGVSQVRW